jgi:hypothetical protein
MIRKILKNKKIIFVMGEQKKEASYFINFVLKDDFSVMKINKLPSLFDFFSLIKSEVIIFEDNEEVSFEKVKELLHFSCFCVFVVTKLKNKSRARSLLNGFKKEWIIISDFSVSRKLEKRKTKETLTFGIDRKKADFYITDISVKDGSSNFKVNTKLNIIPFWVEKELKKREIYSILPGLCVAKIMDINLAEISYKVKEGK